MSVPDWLDRLLVRAIHRIADCALGTALPRKTAAVPATLTGGDSGGQPPARRNVARIFDRDFHLRAHITADHLTTATDGARVAELPRLHPASVWLSTQLAADALKGPTHLVVTVPDSAPWHGVLRELALTRETLTSTWEPVYTVPTSWLPSRPTP